jgi:hypothetical protein
VKGATLILLLGVSLISCIGTREESESQALTFDMKTIRIESKGGCRSDSVACASFEVSYPEFHDLKPEAQEKLEELINRAIAYDNPEADEFSIEEMGNQFVNDFDSFQSEFPENEFGWYFKTTFEVLSNSDTLISLGAASEFFTGGAHGGYTVYYVNMNPETGNTVALQNVLKPGFDAFINQVGEEAFRKSRELSPEDNLAEKGFEFPDGKFALNENYGFKAEGIVFFFNSYEIAPYAMGPTEVLILWESLVEFRK